MIKQTFGAKCQRYPPFFAVHNVQFHIFRHEEQCGSVKRCIGSNSSIKRRKELPLLGFVPYWPSFWTERTTWLVVHLLGLGSREAKRTIARHYYPVLWKAIMECINYMKLAVCRPHHTQHPRETRRLQLATPLLVLYAEYCD